MIVTLGTLLLVGASGANGNNLFTPTPTVTSAPTTAVYSQRANVQSSIRPRSAVATIGAYPGTLSTVKGTIVVKETSDGISMVGTLIGLEASVNGKGIHIHEGVSCATSSDPGGHYWPTSDTYALDTWATDPWASTSYTSDANGASFVSLPDVAGFSLGGDYPVAGRVVVVHDEAGNPVGCGTLQATSGQVVQLGSYPGYEGPYSSAVGTFLVVNALTPVGPSKSNAVTLQGTVSGVEASASGLSVAIHRGFNCAGGDASVDALSGDDVNNDDNSRLLSVSFTSDASGSAVVDPFTVEGVSLDEANSVAHRTVVTHLSSSSQQEAVSCGVLGSGSSATPYSAVATMGAYPGSLSSQASTAVQGTVVVQERSWGSGNSGITLFGSLFGLNRSAVGGIHIHSGFSCNHTSEPGGHYYFRYSGKNESFVSVLELSLQSTTKCKSANKAGLLEAIAHQLKISERNITNFAVTSEQPTPLVAIYTWKASFDVRVPLPFRNSTTAESADYVGLRLMDPTFNAQLNSDVTQEDPGTTVFVVSVDAEAKENEEPGSVDPWTSVTWASDGSGAAFVQWDVADFSLASSRLPVAGRVVVVHDPHGKRVGCGVLRSTSGQVVSLRSGKPQPADDSSSSSSSSSSSAMSGGGGGGFEGGDNGYNTTGTLVVTQNGGGGGGGAAASVTIKGTVINAEPSATSAIAVYEDFTCSAAASSLTHFFDSTPVPAPADPWTSTSFATDSDGAATVDVSSISGFTSTTAFGLPTAYRTLATVQPSSSKLSGCGVVGQSPFTLVATLTKMPGYGGGLDPKGTVVVSMVNNNINDDGSSSGSSGSRTIHLSGTVGGLQSKVLAEGGVRIRNGTSCGAAGTDYYDSGADSANDDVSPWSSTAYTTDEVGSTGLAFTAKGFTLIDGGYMPLVGKVVVLLNRGGLEVACGVLVPTVGEVVTVKPYPGYSGSYAESVKGTIVVAPMETGISLIGTLAGLEASTSGMGLHVHSGYTVDDADGVGGHYYEGDGPDPWLETSYSTDSDGTAVVALQVSNFTLRSAQPVAQRALVVHLSSSQSSTRAGAGLVSTQAAADTAVEYVFGFPSPAPTPWVEDLSYVEVKVTLSSGSKVKDGDTLKVQSATSEQLSRASGGSNVPGSDVTGKAKGLDVATNDATLASSSASPGYKWVVRFSIELSLQKYCGRNVDTDAPCTLQDLEKEVEFMLGNTYPGLQYSNTISQEVGVASIVTRKVQASAYATYFPSPAPTTAKNNKKNKKEKSDEVLSPKQNKEVTIGYSATMAAVALGVGLAVMFYRRYSLNPEGSWKTCYSDHNWQKLGKEQATKLQGHGAGDEGAYDAAAITGGY